MQRMVEAALTRGLNYLASVQQADGSFDCELSPTKRPWRPVQSYRTTFTPALILGALAPLTGQAAHDLRQSLAAWLLGQKNTDWSFNYWAKDALERSTMPYPSDLDDTFCALIGLHLHDPALIDMACLAQVVQLLVAAETQVGGPYRTWLVSKDAPPIWQDVDLAVNSNIAGFLQRVAEPLPNITALLQQAARRRQLASPYYPSPYPLLYYMARAWDGPKQPLIDYILKLRRGEHWGTPLHTALAVSALAQLGHLHTAAGNYLLKAQQPDGSWPAEAFWTDPAHTGQAHYCGGASLTTALVLEALARTAGTTPPAASTPQKTATRRPPRAAQTFYNQVLAKATSQLQALAPNLRRAALKMLKSMDAASDNQGIVALPWLFARSLKRAPHIDDAILLQLGLANLYGWMAYTIYDDFLDDEGDPRLLSVANTALRYSLQAFRQALPAHDEFQAKVQQVFDCIDGANAWELAHCRLHVQARKITAAKLPRYRSTLGLAERSLGHALTPLGVLAAAGIGAGQAPARCIESALKHYLAARQLSDDLHDWKADLAAGQSSYVVTALLRALALPATPQNINRLLPRLQRQFWNQTLPEICSVMAGHTAQARSFAVQSGLLEDANVLSELLDGIEASIAHTTDEQSKAQNFLQAYRASS